MKSLLTRIKDHRWSILLAGTVCATAMATALAVAPDDRPLAQAAIDEALNITGLTPIQSDGHLFMQEDQIERGDTLSSVLQRLQVSDDAFVAFLRTDPQARQLAQQLAPGKSISLQTNDDGQVLHLYFPLNASDSALVIDRENGALVSKIVAERFETGTVSKSGIIHSSLFGATDAADIPDAVAIGLAELFGGDIDFNSDLRKGDRFSVTYEMKYLQGGPVRSGRILSAEFVNNGTVLRALLFPLQGAGAYYTPEGKPLKKAFLRSPIAFSRVTSGFKMRFHPILKEWRAHKGVDFAAAEGTKVRATGDATVSFSGFQRGYGNIVVLRHSGKYSTAYAHLQRIASGIRNGSRVSQGDTIGYVGHTGWATGPHLHYEFRVADKPINPLSIEIPVTSPLVAAQKAQFKAETAPLLSLLETLSSSNISNLE